VHLHGALLAANRLTNVGRPSQGRPSFLKKEAKFFGAPSRFPPSDHTQRIKVFWFFFSKKNTLPERNSSISIICRKKDVLF
jgi:hypothetical protein